MSCFFSSKRSPPSSTRTYTLFPYTTLFRSTVRPMKGTAPRHADPALDQQAAQELLNSAKNRAENLMIVDLLRNDLGRLATPGSVQVENLFRSEEHTSELQSLMRISYAVFFSKQTTKMQNNNLILQTHI